MEEVLHSILFLFFSFQREKSTRTHSLDRSLSFQGEGPVLVLTIDFP